MALLAPILLLLLLAMRTPVGFALLITGVFGTAQVTGSWEVALSSLNSAPYSSVADSLLSVIPMFVLLAYVASESGYARDAFDSASAWFSRRRGGLALSTTATSGIFGALSGSTTAAASSLATITVPNMVRHGYSQTLASGVAALGSTLAVLFPPSVLMIVYGVTTETSIGALLLAGIGPGLVLMIGLMAAIFVWVWVRPQDSSLGERVELRKKIKLTLKIWPVLLLMALVMILLYSGVVTAVEVGATGALAALIMTVVSRRLTLQRFLTALHNTVNTTVMIFAIIIGGHLFGAYVALSGLPATVSELILGSGMNRWLVIVIIVVGYFILSMFMDEIPLLLTTLPVTFPVITALGFDPVWFGAISMMMVIMGLVFPPVGLTLFIVSNATGVRLEKVAVGAAVLLIPVVITVACLMLFPDIALWLPGHAGLG